ncbi:MAG: hypothetical protein Q9208_007894 [Pyrenodesmia sp. 3 TL-2023]
MAQLDDKIQPLVQSRVLDHFRGLPYGSLIDLYDSMKSLSWQILLSLFLEKDDERGNGEDIAEIEALHEELLRGQFSLFPVSIDTRFWRSPRAKGLQARQSLQSLLQSKVIRGKCPFAVGNRSEGQDIANHLLLFTSSLAAKALASLLTAVLINLYLFKEGESVLSTKIRSLEDPEQRSRYIQSMIREVERLSPPVVGIMRRTTDDILLESEGDAAPPTLIPKAWDLWLYFAGAGRDPAAFGETAEKFVPSRYFDAGVSVREGLAFGTGAKACLGEGLIRTIVTTVVETCLGHPQGTKAKDGSDDWVVKLEGDEGGLPAGVQGWLGWQAGVKPEEWARDIKQLPTQRPRKRILLQVKHQLVS